MEHFARICKIIIVTVKIASEYVLRHPRISKISRGHALRPPLATLVTTLPAAAYGRKSSTPKLKILSTALPSVPSPDRKKAQQLVTNPQPLATGEGEGEREGEAKPLAWRAPRTGKVIRSIHAGKG